MSALHNLIKLFSIVAHQNHYASIEPFRDLEPYYSSADIIFTDKFNPIKGMDKIRQDPKTVPEPRNSSIGWDPEIYDVAKKWDTNEYEIADKFNLNGTRKLIDVGEIQDSPQYWTLLKDDGIVSGDEYVSIIGEMLSRSLYMYAHCFFKEF